MESKTNGIDLEPSEADARAALAEAGAARQAVAHGVHYPSTYRPLMAFSGAGLPLLVAAWSDGVPNAAVNGVLLVVGLLSVMASGLALSVFEKSNGVRITGLRSGKRLSGAYLAATLVLLIGVAAVAHGTDAWWVALIAAPVSGAIALIYVDGWLADYHRHGA